MKDNILVTGGTGFIGSHTCISLIESKFNLTVIDANINSSPISLKRINKIIEKNNYSKDNKLIFKKGDIRDKNFLRDVFSQARQKGNPINAVIHFAGLKAVKESVEDPILYWDNNVVGSLRLFEVMTEFQCKTIVFSSSATVYGTVKSSPILENFPIIPENPYGQTKASVESILSSIYKSSNNSWRIANLRYFNPIGAHESGLIGEDPNDLPNNLFPLMCKVALGKIDKLKVFGNDWPTKDGTGIRDYVHVMDLADAHKATLDLLTKNEPQFLNLNIGTGIGTSVLELINKFQNSTNRKISYSIEKRRPGDVAILVANNQKAIQNLDWYPKRSLEDMCRDGFNWQLKNPDGYIAD